MAVHSKDELLEEAHAALFAADAANLAFKSTANMRWGIDPAKEAQPVTRRVRSNKYFTASRAGYQPDSDKENVHNGFTSSAPASRATLTFGSTLGLIKKHIANGRKPDIFTSNNHGLNDSFATPMAPRPAFQVDLPSNFVHPTQVSLFQPHRKPENIFKNSVAEPPRRRVRSKKDGYITSHPPAPRGNSFHPSPTGRGTAFSKSNDARNMMGVPSHMRNLPTPMRPRARVGRVQPAPTPMSTPKAAASVTAPFKGLAMSKHVPMHLRVVSQPKKNDVEEGEIVEKKPAKAAEKVTKETKEIVLREPIVWLEAVESDNSITRLF